MIFPQFFNKIFKFISMVQVETFSVKKFELNLTTLTKKGNLPRPADKHPNQCANFFLNQTISRFRICDALCLKFITAG